MSKIKLVLVNGSLYGYSTKINKVDRRNILVNILEKHKSTYQQVITRLNILRIYNKYQDNNIWNKVTDDMLYLKKIFRPHLLNIYKNRIKSKKPKLSKKKANKLSNKSKKPKKKPI